MDGERVCGAAKQHAGKKGYVDFRIFSYRKVCGEWQLEVAYTKDGVYHEELWRCKVQRGKPLDWWY